MPIQDSLIAATAIVHGLAVVSASILRRPVCPLSILSVVEACRADCLHRDGLKPGSVKWLSSPQLSWKFLPTGFSRQLTQKHGFKVALDSVDIAEMLSLRENDFECLASTGVLTPTTAKL
jgi:hypothetical protein